MFADDKNLHERTATKNMKTASFDTNVIDRGVH